MFSCSSSLLTIFSDESWPKEFQKTFFLKTTEIKRINDSVDIIGHFKVCTTKNLLYLNKFRLEDSMVDNTKMSAATNNIAHHERQT